ncbi:MAG TPA: HDOD domain-containing protein [Burkholderiaceae bacterium]|jgi:HD-like signal output (HDOD) protein|nr:HDOD domain-containing protein [Burkholderiaceae bacterium]
MPKLPTQSEIDSTLKGFAIPPRPQVLISLSDEMNQDEPDLKLIARQIGGDVGLAGAVLKMVNSPFFGLTKKISSVTQAVSLLGLKSVETLVTSIMLRASIGGNNRALEQFWDSAERAAGIAAHIAASLPQGPRDDAYSFGLFHNAAIPILSQRYPNYFQTLEMAGENSERCITDIEDERHAVNHATLGYLIAKAWFLPPPICEGILRHHDPSVFNDKDGISPQALTLIAITYLAEHFNDDALMSGDHSQWGNMSEKVLSHLGIQDSEYLNLKEEIAGFT